MGRINQTWAYDQKHVRRYGKLYGSIDFEINEHISRIRYDTENIAICKRGCK